MSRPEKVDSVALGDEFEELASLGQGSPLPDTELPPVHVQVSAVAATSPDKIAVECAGISASYGELESWAGQVMARLAAAGVSPGSRVGLLAEPSVAAIAAVLGILRCGAAYTPLDIGQPDQQIAAVVADARVDAMVATAATAGRLATLGRPVVQIAGVWPGAGGREQVDPVPPAASVGADTAAYLIYTSGSTGEPKGVVVEHGSLAASTLARQTVYPGAPVFLLVSPLAFDSSAAGLWGTLTTGGRLIVATSDDRRDPERLVELIEKHQVTRLLCIPSMYDMVLSAAARAGGWRRLRCLETVIVAGESLPETVVARHFALHSRAVALVNEYGPTEATVWATYHRFHAPGPVSIGRPAPGVSLYLLDDERRLVPRGVEGELYIGGPGVAREYFGRQDATDRAFLDDPFAGVAGARMYRTGDLGRWNSAGTLDFLGRRDDQVKLRGHRVELGAVEAALRSVPGIEGAVVLPDSTRTQLVGFVLASSGADVESARVRVADRLPASMVPTRVEVLDSFPLTVNGKVDRTLLRATTDARPDGVRRPAREATGTADAPHEPVDLLGQVVAAWAEVLRTSEVPADVNFFDLGGHSLNMFQLQGALEKHTGVRPSVVALFRHTTAAAQAALIRETSAGPSGAAGGSDPPRSPRDRLFAGTRQRTGDHG